MPGSEENKEDCSQLELELYFLIARFLSSGPCKKSAEALKEELRENKLLFRRLDWEGGEHFRSYDTLLDIYRHISNDHLLKVVQRIGPLLEKDVKSSVRGVSSLLGAGRQSLLRTSKDVDQVRWPGATYAARHHGRPLLPPRNLVHTNITQITSAYHMSGVVQKDLACYPSIYGRMTRAFRALGHLSAVYCICFDRTGSFIITGADDHLIKIWSAHTGRLLTTLRGHSLEITDIAVNYENTLLAAGSCDKTIRVWCLRTMAPKAVLHGHTGMITSLSFCPYIRGENRYLVSTGGDGCVCYWHWSTKDNKFNPKPIKFIERSRAGAQMLCSSFSPGGVFLATGSSDNVIRVYCFTSSAPEKICELEAHTDRVDSIQYSNHSNRFVSGSKDGNARIWRYERQEWKATVLNAASKLPGAPSSEEDTKSNKCKVNMICWSENDQYVIIAVNDYTLKVWDSHTGTLQYVLSGHTDEVFVLEANPVDYRIMLSAGHDGNIILWDIVSGKMITKYFNVIEGQGHGAVYDCKWSPDGRSFATTDSHGFTMLYIFGSNERYKRLPEEMFFHTDYRPLIRDANNFVLDEQTQQPPHLMPPPFLVDIDGNPHPSWLQRLVPGREAMSDAMLVPQIGYAPNGDREVLDEIPIDDPEPEEEEAPAGNIDDMIERLQRRQDQRGGARQDAPRIQSPRQDGPLSPPIRGPRRSGEVEGVRAASGHVPVSQRATDTDIAAWRQRVVVWGLDPAVIRNYAELRQAVAEDEIKRYVAEKRKKPLAGSEDNSSDSGSQIRTRRQRQRTRRRQQPRSNLQTSRNRLTTRALYDTEEEEEEEDEDDTIHQSASEPEEPEVESDHLWNSSSSDSESSEYSDWAADGGINLQPPKRTSQRQQKKKRFSSSEEEEDDDDEVVASTSHGSSAKQKAPKVPTKKKDSRKEKRERQQRQVLQRRDSIVELPEAFKPPDWLTNAIPRKTPYVPQMGDEVIYFQQGHKLYLSAVQQHNVYNINVQKNLPWIKNPNLRDTELVKVVGLKYELRPPRLVCLKLAFIDPETSHLSGGSFTIKYHDMPDVIDFLVLKQTYDRAMTQHWKAGDKFRSMIDDAWWNGKISRQEPFQAEFPDSMFQCFHVQWDNNERERMSPWDLEPIDASRKPTEVGGSVEVTQKEMSVMIYQPKEGEWPDCERDVECDRISHGLSAIMELSIAEHFLAPVDLNAFPAYAMVIEYPVDLSTIKARLENRYYRRVTSVQYDVRYIETNASKFNEPNSRIVKCAKLITELTLRFISDCDCMDPMPMYAKLAKDADFKVPMRSAAAHPEYDEDTEVDIDEPSSSNAAPRKTKKKKSIKIPDKDAWKAECREMLQALIQCEDSTPFRSAVDPIEYPTYYEIIDHPMDLGSVREQLECSVYESPVEFCKDMRLVFNNSRSYNTNKRSRIYVMTLRLSAMFEDQIRPIINDYKSALKYEKTGRLPPNVKKQIKKKQNGTGPSTSTPRPKQPGEADMSSTPNTSASTNKSTPVNSAGASKAQSATTSSKAAPKAAASKAPSKAVPKTPKKAVPKAPSRAAAAKKRAMVPRVTVPRTMVPRVMAPRVTVQRATVPHATVKRVAFRRATITRLVFPRATVPQKLSSRHQRQARTGKRKRDSSSEEDGDDSDSDSDYTEFESKPRKRPPPRKKPTRKPPSKSSRRRSGVSNGHSSRYGTRNTTGTLKRKSYEDDEDLSELELKEENFIEEEFTAEQSDSATEVSDSVEETEEEVKPKKGTNVKGAARRAMSRLTRSTGKRKKIQSDSSTEEEEEQNDSDNANSDDDSDNEVVKQNSDSDSNSDNNNDSDEEDDDETEIDVASDSDSEVGVRRSRRTTTRQNTKATKSVTDEAQRRSLSTESDRPKRISPRASKTPNKSFQDYSSDEGSFESNAASRSARKKKLNTRSAGRRTVRYEEDSDFEIPSSRQANSDNSDDDRSVATSMSSRGRIRKLTPRARANLLGSFG